MRKNLAAAVLAAAVFLGQTAAFAYGDTVKKGSTVVLTYFLEADGQPVISADKKTQMTVIVGGGTHPPTFERQLIGLKKGDRKNIRLTPDQAFGPVREELIKRIPKGEFPPSIPLKEGLMLGGKKGQRPIRIAKVLEDSVVLDENHPFAGKTLDYHIEVTDVE